MTVAPINHARDRAIQAALRAHLHLTRCHDAEALAELTEAMAFAVALTDPDCCPSILPGDDSMADAAEPPPAASAPNSDEVTA